MALSQELEDVIAELEKVDAPAAKEYRATLEKFPALQKPLAERGMRQSDYDRRMNEVKDDLENAKKVREWYNGPEGKSAYDAKDASLKAAIAKQKDLEAEVAKRAVVAASLTTALGPDGKPIDPAVLAEKVLESLRGHVVGKTEIEAMVTAEAQKLVTAQFEEARQKFYKDDFAPSAQWLTSMTDAQLRYHDETGKRMDRKEFAKFMSDNKIDDPEKAYEQFVAPIKREKEVETLAEKRAQEILAKRTEAGGFPGSSGAPGSGGHLQVRLHKKEANDPLFGSEVALGDNTLAAAAAAELSAEGK
jgi:hypothetical protein